MPDIHILPINNTEPLAPNSSPSTIKKTLELPLKLGSAFAASEILGYLLADSPDNYDEMFSLSNIISGESKILTNCVAMHLPLWDYFFPVEKPKNGFFEKTMSLATHVSKGFFAFTAQSIMANVIRFSVPPQWQINFFLHTINALLNATLLDYLNDKKFSRKKFIQLITVLVYRESASNVDAMLLALLSEMLSMDVTDSMLPVVTQFFSDVILPVLVGITAGGAFDVTDAGVKTAARAANAGAKMVTDMGTHIKECAVSFWHREKSQDEERASFTSTNEVVQGFCCV